MALQCDEMDGSQSEGDMDELLWDTSWSLSVGISLLDDRTSTAVGGVDSNSL